MLNKLIIILFLFIISCRPNNFDENYQPINCYIELTLENGEKKFITTYKHKYHKKKHHKISINDITYKYEKVVIFCYD